jgi:hypothetical protein
LNDENDETFADTMVSQFSYMELDLGAGGKMTNRVRMRHGDNVLQSNNMTLYVLDNERRVIMQHFITHLKTDSRAVSDFIIADAEDDSAGLSLFETRMVRYLRLTRTSGRDHMNEQLLEGFLGSRADACFRH